MRISTGLAGCGRRRYWGVPITGTGAFRMAWARVRCSYCCAGDGGDRGRAGRCRRYGAGTAMEQRRRPPRRSRRRDGSGWCSCWRASRCGLPESPCRPAARRARGRAAVRAAGGRAGADVRRVHRRGGDRAHRVGAPAKPGASWAAALTVIAAVAAFLLAVLPGHGHAASQPHAGRAPPEGPPPRGPPRWRPPPSACTPPDAAARSCSPWQRGWPMPARPW